MDHIKTHFDKYLLALAGLILAAWAIHLVGESSALPEQFTPPKEMQSGAAFVPEKKIAQFKADLENMNRHQIWEDASGSLFVSREYILQDGRLVDIMQGDEEIFPGIPNQWLKDNRLDYTDKKLLERDPDDDGYTNLEEFRAGTDPNDSNSHPAPWTKLRVVAVKKQNLNITFQTVTDESGGEVREVQINTITPEDSSDRRGVTKFYKIGDVIKISERQPSGVTVETPTPFKFVRAENKQDAYSEPDIILQNIADGKEIRLEKEKVTPSPYPRVTLKDTRNGQEQVVRVGDDFTIADSGTYKLIDATEEKAQIKNLKTEEVHVIQRETSTAAPQPHQ